MKNYRIFSIITILLTGILAMTLFLAAGTDAAEEPDELQEVFYDYDLAPYGSVLSRNLSFGMSGADVTALQSMLYRLGYLSVELIDGYFGEETRSAVSAFQQDYVKNETDGSVGPRTKRAFNIVLSNASELPGFLIYDAILPVGVSYTAEAMFADGGTHEVTISTSSPNIAISGMTITALSSGSAEVCAISEGKSYKFFVSIRDTSEIAARVGIIENANDLWRGLDWRIAGLASYPGDIESMTLFAGDCFLDERLFLLGFESRFTGKNVYSIALSGSTTSIWKTMIRSYVDYQPASLVLCIGTNDVRRGKPASEVIASIEELIEMTHQYMPGTMVYWWNIMPHLESEQDYYKIQAVNAAILEYSRQDSQLAVVDCYGAVTDENGVANPSLYRDPLHPNEAGYDQLFQKTAEAGLKIE